MAGHLAGAALDAAVTSAAAQPPPNHSQPEPHLGVLACGDHKHAVQRGAWEERRHVVTMPARTLCGRQAEREDRGWQREVGRREGSKGGEASGSGGSKQEAAALAHCCRCNLSLPSHRVSSTPVPKAWTAPVGGERLWKRSCPRSYLVTAMDAGCCDRSGCEGKWVCAIPTRGSPAGTMCVMQHLSSVAAGNTQDGPPHWQECKSAGAAQFNFVRHA